MYLNAESVKVDTDEGRITLEVFGYANTPDADEVRLTINIHEIDLDAFYASVRSGVGGYLRERDEAKNTFVAQGGYARLPFVCAPADVDESGGYDVSDPKHPRYHSTHVDIWDARDGK